jgi:hypothetical protein
LANGQALKNYFLVIGNNALVNGQLPEILPWSWASLEDYFLVIRNNALLNSQALKIIF